MSESGSSSENVQIDANGNPDVRASYKVEIERTHYRKKAVTVFRPDGTVLYRDKFDPDNAKARSTFLDELTRKDPNIEKHRVQIDTKLVTNSAPPADTACTPVSYSAGENGMYVHTGEGQEQITNWSARIVGNIAKDDGSGQVETIYEVDVVCGDTARDVRGRGYGPLTCAPLIEYCLDLGIEPIWGCFAWNHAALAVARKLGFADPVHHTSFKWTPFNGGRRMVVLPSTTLGDYVGHYRMKTIPAEIRVDGDGLLYIDENRQPLSLAAETTDRFFFRHFDIQVEFTLAPDGRVDGLIRHQSGRQFRMERV